MKAGICFFITVTMLCTQAMAATAWLLQKAGNSGIVCEAGNSIEAATMALNNMIERAMNASPQSTHPKGLIVKLDEYKAMDISGKFSVSGPTLSQDLVTGSFTACVIATQQ